MENCLFCRIVRGEIPSTKVFEDDQILAFKDLEPQAPVHVLVVPKKHYDSIMQLKAEDGALLAHVFEVIQYVANEFDIAEKGFRVVVNTGKEGGQSVDHVHFHVLGGRSMEWPPG